MKRLAFILLLLAAPAAAHDGYDNLTQPGGGSCCGGQDCAPTETRTVNGQLQAHIVRISGQDGWTGDSVDLWADVPEAAILPAEKNPKAGPSACWHPGLGIICFLWGRGS